MSDNEATSYTYTLAIGQQVIPCPKSWKGVTMVVFNQGNGVVFPQLGYKFRPREHELVLREPVDYPHIVSVIAVE